MQLMTNINLLLALTFSHGEYLESHFEFVGHVPIPVDADSVSKEVTISHCFSSCIQNSNCYSFDFCANRITETCYMYERNRTNVLWVDGGPCRRYKLRQLCEREFTKPCRCPDNRGGERCKYKYDCSGNLVSVTTSSYSYFKEFSNGKTKELYCDMITDGGRWIVFQMRSDGSVDFFRNWTEYREGFGNLNNFYIGNQALHEIVKEGNFELRIDLEDQTGELRYAKYSDFSLGGPENNYTLAVKGYTGNANDSFIQHNGRQFSTFDMDNDIYPDPAFNCADYYHGGWWYASCAQSNLNGLFGEKNHRGLLWYDWKGAFDSTMKSSKMMTRMKR
ncbi:fibrinogen-like protein A [Saccostrea cucullata]|uniref:fibrinogen-like protein A n=1 Tax=Saccostrea cuccullata TaxID=36930 RepID=UPI002ED61AA2